MSFKKYIDSILDTPKVEGLLILDLGGSVHFEQVSEGTEPVELEKLPQRILMMYDIIADNFQNCSDFILKFEKKSLYLRKSSDKKGKDFILVILGDASINFVTLKLVLNLAMKMIELDVQPSTEEVSPVENNKSNSKLTYRGQQVNTENPPGRESKKKRSGLVYRGKKL